VKPTNPSHALALVLCDELVRLGMTDACLAPGSRSAPLAMALAEDDRIRLHVGIDERSTGFLALGIARASGYPAAVLSTSGTAAVNFHPAVVEADADRVPLLVLTADRPPELRHTSANQTIDQVKLYGDAVRLFADVGPPEDRADASPYWRSLICRAWSEAIGIGAPAGPVHLNLAFREPLVPVEIDERSTTEGGFTSPIDGRADGRPWTAVGRSPRPPAEPDVEEIAALIESTERGLLVVGGVGDAARIAPAVGELARAAGWPVLAEPLSGARSGDNAIAAYHVLLSHEGFADAHRPDLVLRIGKVGLSRALLRFLDHDVPQVLVDRDGAWLDPERSAARIVAADPDLTCGALTVRLGARPVTSWLGSWRESDASARGIVDAILDGEERPTEPRTARDVADSVPSGGSLVVGSSMPVRDLDQFMAPRDDLAVYGNRGASGIDGFVSTALGVAIAHRGPTSALCGDLTLLHDATGFLLGDRAHVDLVLVVVNNDGGGIFSMLPQAEFAETFETVFGTPHGVEISLLVGAFGVGHRLVVRANDLVGALDDARETGGIQVVEVRTHRDENAALHRRITAEVRRALGG
jgi:2-succinyl-5-enolpyruvyl-6-hydroxy-3-cyclohexene-1-carboxylate synthase